MAPNFEVGSRYSNRVGPYEVVELDGPDMVIRYDDGQKVNTSVAMQARIRANMKAEKEARLRAAQARVGRRTSRARVDFSGLGEQDFQGSTAGTTWRARTALGGLLAQNLSQAVNEAFQSYAVYGQTKVHIAIPECYHKSLKEGCRDAKFVFELDEEGALYGLYIEKNSGPMDEAWHWPNLLAALNENVGLQEGCLAAMRRLELQWEVYANPADELLACVVPGDEGLEWQPAEGEAAAIGWPELVQRLSEIDEGEWCNLYLCARMPKELAIAAGPGVAAPAVQVFRALLPLYEAAVRRR